MTNKDTILARIVEVIREHFSLPPEKEILPVTHLFDDLGGDSLDISEISMELEDEFGIHINDDKMPQTVSDAFEQVMQAIA